MISVANMDIAGIAGRFAQFAQELIVSQSAGQPEFVIHDRRRTTTLLDYLLTYVDAITKPANPLDLVASHGSVHPVLDFPTDEAVHAISNMLVMDLLCRFKAAWLELTASQSINRASGLHEADVTRLKEIIANCRLFIELGEAEPTPPGSASTPRS